MGTKSEETKGRFEEVTGEVKKDVGRAIGNEQMRTEGAARKEKGRGRSAVARTAGRLKGMARKAFGRAQQRVSRVLGNRSKQARGAARRARGAAEKGAHS